jgi:hypothetical protein
VNIKNRQQVLAILAISAVVLLLGDRLVLGPLTRTWKEHSQKIADLKRSISQGDVLLGREKIIHDSWQQMHANTLPLNLSAAEDEVFKAFYRWSEESQISISSIKSQWKRNADDYMVLECSADGFGSIETITRFLYELEKDPLALRVESVKVSTRDANGQQLSLSLQVSGLLLSPEDL